MFKQISYFYLDNLSIIMLVLVGFVSLVVGAFSMRYLAGDSMVRPFFTRLVLLVAAVFCFVLADNLILFWAGWTASNVLLVRLIVHKKQWEAARQSGILAFKNFAIGSVALSVAFAALYVATGSLSIQEIIRSQVAGGTLGFALLFLSLAALTQSAIFPFHSWLASSLNSPTPVSAIMHAGLVNGGGFLLARFAPLYIQLPSALTLLFIIGMATAFIGTLFKLMQSSVKPMLAYSTMGQMGFMVLQCGLGLFPAAVAHLCWHGLFKAYLFLGSGSAAQERRQDLAYPPSAGSFALALIYGLAGAATFAFASHKDFFAGDTTTFLVGIAWISGAQLAITILQKVTVKRLIIAAIMVPVAGALYGLSVWGISLLLAGPLAGQLAVQDIMVPQPLGFVHYFSFGVLVAAWFCILFWRSSAMPAYAPNWALKLYVQLINASQPQAKTITSSRNHYQF